MWETPVSVPLPVPSPMHPITLIWKGVGGSRGIHVGVFISSRNSPRKNIGMEMEEGAERTFVMKNGQWGR